MWASLTAATGVLCGMLLLWAYYAWFGGWAWWNETPFWYPSHGLMEVPLILAVLLACAWPAGSGRLAWFLGCAAGAVPLIGAYAVIDAFCRAFNRPPTFADLGLLPELLRADPFLGLAACAALLGLIVPPVITWLLWCRGRSWRVRSVALVARAVLFAAVLLLFWAPAARERWERRVGFHFWSDLHCIKDFGHLATCWEVAARTTAARARLASLAASPDAPAFPAGPVPEPRNIYLVMLESFVDARDFAPAVAGAVHPDMIAALPPDGRFDHCLSPVFGGYSAQAEFELLTGAPAMAAAGPIDYQWFSRRPCDGLIASAAAAGYRTVLAYGAGSEFFNAPNAHMALGFGERHYGNSDAWGVRDPADVFITDADLTTAVLDQLRRGDDHRPVCTLIVGMEGHERDGSTFPRDRNRFPDVIHSPDHAVDELANLFHWRSKAIAGLLARLAREDPRAVILVMGDHQPAVLAGVPMAIDRYAVPAVLLVGGRRVAIDGRRMRELPWLIWGALLGKPPDIPGPDAMRQRYEAIIARQMRP